VGGTVERATLATTELGNPASLGFVNMGGVLPHLGRLPRVSQGAEDDDRNPRLSSYRYQPRQRRRDRPGLTPTAPAPLQYLST
jgi:hypothetical protein